MIEEARRETTAGKLFKGIVNNTVDAQFGDKHATLRELGQNGIDSYSPGDLEKQVLFSIRAIKEFNERFRYEQSPQIQKAIILTAKDKGCGMDLKDIVKDLLIPYNSNKEFDPTKIGEHGIGWFSIVDLADIVKVSSKKKGSDHKIESVIYKKDDSYRAAISVITLPKCRENNKEVATEGNVAPEGKFAAEGKFAQEGNNDSLLSEKKDDFSGTEVMAVIPEGKTTIETMRDSFFLYLGMISKQDGQLFLETIYSQHVRRENINSVRDEYAIATPSVVKIGDSQGHLTMGVSKRLMLAGQSDSRFNIRDKNLEQMLMTQRGLFVKFNKMPFDDKTVHAQIMNSLIQHGFDFWVDIPKNVVLVKGRNNIVPEHEAAILDAMYSSFETLFLDTILNDDEVLHGASSKVLELIAGLFNSKYSASARLFEIEKHSLKKRIISKTAEYASDTIDWLCEAGRKTKGLLVDIYERICDYPSMMVKHEKEQYSSVTGEIWRAAKKYVVPALVTFGALAGALKIYEAYGEKPFEYLMIGAFSAVIILGTYVIGKKTNEFFKLLNDMRSQENNSEKEGLMMKLAKKVGLYTNIEEKRENACKRKRQKVVDKYLSSIQKDCFFGRIMHKQIVPATQYSTTIPENEQRKHWEFRDTGWMPGKLSDYYSSGSNIVTVSLTELALEEKGNSQENSRILEKTETQYLGESVNQG